MIKFSNGALINKNNELVIWTSMGRYIFDDNGRRNFNKTLDKMLEKSNLEEDLVYIDSFRGFGFTEALVRFAKSNNLPLIVSSQLQANNLITEHNYKNIFSKNHNSLKGTINKWNKCLIDSCINIENLPSDVIYIGFTNLINNFINNDKNVKTLSAKELLLDELKSLGEKIQKTRLDGDVGTYKNLIIAYRGVLELLKDLGMDISKL